MASQIHVQLSRPTLEEVDHPAVVSCRRELRGLGLVEDRPVRLRGMSEATPPQPPKGLAYHDREILAQSVRNCIRPEQLTEVAKRIEKLRECWENQISSEKKQKK